MVDGNVAELREEQWLKSLSPRVVIWDGNVTDVKEEHS